MYESILTVGTANNARNIDKTISLNDTDENVSETWKGISTRIVINMKSWYEIDNTIMGIKYHEKNRAN